MRVEVRVFGPDFGISQRREQKTNLSSNSQVLPEGMNHSDFSSVDEDSSSFSTFLMSVNNHGNVKITVPTTAHIKKRLDVPVNSTIAPEIIIPKGCAAEDNAMSTEFTLPCISNGATVWIIVRYDSAR